MEIITTVTDDLYDELTKLTGQKVVSFSIWDESLADALVGSEDDDESEKSQNLDSAHVDIDLYLSDGVYFELYSTVCFPDLNSNPITQAEAMETALSSEIKDDVWLDEVAVDDENQLVLVLSRNHQSVLYLMVGGWTVDGWEELPNDVSQPSP